MPTICLVESLNWANQSIENDPVTDLRHFQVDGHTLLACIQAYGLLIGKRIEAADPAPHFHLYETSLFSDHSVFMCRVRREGQVITPRSFDFPVLASDELIIEFPIC